MKFLTLTLFLLSFICFSQTDLQKANYYLNKKGEVNFEFQIKNKSELKNLTKRLSIISYNKNTNIVKANANKIEFNLFLTKNYPFIVTIENNEIGQFQMSNKNFSNTTNTSFSYILYPTYNEYLSIMADFETDFPTLCKKIEIGTSVQNRKLLAVKLSNNVSIHEQEPRFLYVSTMHGDETTGYPLMLRLIEYLLDNYGTDTNITNLLDNSEIYISPLHNPDGIYAAGNTTISGAIRRNANNIDLNRNFPDPEDGLHPDGNTYQPETLAYMAFTEANHFVLAANIHGGAEVINYPWDTFENLSADDDYWTYVSREYTDQVHLHNATYMDGFNNGITNGNDWYEVQGGRQDYMNYYLHTRELTIEISNQKAVPGGQLPTYWDYNKDAFIKYMQQVTFGIRGVVIDVVTGTPIKAKIFISNKDERNTWVETELPFGDYYRPVKGGTYQVTYSAPCYESKTVTVTAIDLNSTVQNIALQPLTETPITNDVTINNGETATLTTTTNGTINWFETETSITPLATGTNFITPNLVTTRSYFVENSAVPTQLQIITPNNNTNGTFINANEGLVFDCFEAIKLHKITVNTQNSGTITLELQDNDSNILQSETFNVSSGIQELIIDFDIPIGRDLKLIKTSGVPLFYNNINISYPYTLERYINLKRNTSSTNTFNHYYSFYNWILQQPTCISERKEVIVTVQNTATIEDFSNNFMIYPNPANFVLNISLINYTKNLSITIYDILGKQIIKKKYTNANELLSLDISILNRGNYYIRLESNNSSVTKNLTVN